MKTYVRSTSATPSQAWTLLLAACLLTAPVFRAAAAVFTWTNACGIGGVGGNMTWTNAANWIGGTNVPPGTYPSTNGVPRPNDDVRFYADDVVGQIGATNEPGRVNNIIASSITVTSLIYYPFNPGYRTTTLINPGVTLLITNNPSVAKESFSFRHGYTAPTNVVGIVTIMGEGSLVVGNPGNPGTLSGNYTRVHGTSTNVGSTTLGTLVMSNLNNFSFGLAELRVGASGSSAATRGRLILARTNLIVAAFPSAGTSGFIIGQTTATGAGAFDSWGDVQLGQTNLILVNNLKVGGGRSSLGSMEFQSGLSNPTLKLRGSTGSGAVDTLAIGDNYYGPTANNTGTTTGVLDLSGGVVDALVDKLRVGRNINGTAATGSTRAGSGNGTLTWTAGTFDVVDLQLGRQNHDNVASVTGVMNVRSNATLTCLGMYIGRDAGPASGTGNGTLNIVYGGQVTVTNSILEDSTTTTGSSTVNLTNGTLTVGGLVRVDNFNLENATNTLTVGPTISSANPVCNVTNLTLNTSVTLNVSGSGLTLASYPLLKYMGSIGGGGFGVVTLGTQPAPAYGYLFNNTANSSIDLVVTNVPATKWDGTVDDKWDINTTTNWIYTTNNAAAAYQEGDTVIFDDSATGTKTVDLTTILSPAAVAVITTNTYTFIGTGGLGGSGGLYKSGSGTLEVANSGANSYSGTTLVAGGTLRVNSALTGSGAMTVQAGGMLSGTGAISGPVTISSGGTLAAGNSIGTLTFSNTLVLSAGSSNVFEVNGDTLASDQVAGFGAVTYGGNLVISFSGGGTALTNGAAIQLFSGLGTRSGSFAAIGPAPGPALGWDTSTLATDGKLRILQGNVVIWTNVSGGDLLWSNPANWVRTNDTYAGSATPNTVPTATDHIDFSGPDYGSIYGATNVLGATNNIVTADTTVLDLTYSSRVPAYHTMLINPGVTLTVVGIEGDDSFGQRPGQIDGSTLSHVAIRGAGRLVVGDTNSPFTDADIRLHIASTNTGTYWATMDMSGLDYFACAPGRLRVGGSGSSAGTHGTWLMAKTNLVILGGTATTSGNVGLVIGQTTTGNDYTSAGDVQLGQENVLRLSHLRVGGSRATNTFLGGPGGGVGGASQAGAGGTMEFQSGLIAPTLTVRGIDGTNAASVLSIGDNYYAGASSTNTSTGVLDLSGGKVDILVNSIRVGRVYNTSAANSTRNGGGNGTLTWTAGTIIGASSAYIGRQDLNNLGSCTGVVNVRSNAVFWANDIAIGSDVGAAAGTGNGTLNIVHGGQVTVTNNLVEDNVVGYNGSSTVNITNGTLTVGANITNDTLNVYAGTVTVGGLAVVTTLQGAGTVGGSVIVNGVLSPGNSIDTLTITSNLVLSATSTNVFEVDSDTLAHDMVIGLSNVTYGGKLFITTNGGSGLAITNGAAVQLFSANSYSGSFAAIVPPTPAPGLVWNTNALTTSGTLGIEQVAAAVNDTASRPAGFPLTILKSVLVANDTGAGPMSVLSTDSTSTNGAAISTNANYVFYSPPLLNPDVTDRFTYTMTDGYFTSVGTVVVTISSPPTNQSLNITGISTNGDGNYTISFAGVPTNIYLVQATTNIVTPIWVSIGTNTAGTNGLWSFTDLEATNYPSRFYRTARP